MDASALGKSKLDADTLATIQQDGKTVQSIKNAHVLFRTAPGGRPSHWSGDQLIYSLKMAGSGKGGKGGKGSKGDKGKKVSTIKGKRQVKIPDISPLLFRVGVGNHFLISPPVFRGLFMLREIDKRLSLPATSNRLLPANKETGAHLRAFRSGSRVNRHRGTTHALLNQIRHDTRPW